MTTTTTRKPRSPRRPTSVTVEIPAPVAEPVAEPVAAPEPVVIVAPVDGLLAGRLVGLDTLPTAPTADEIVAGMTRQGTTGAALQSIALFRFYSSTPGASYPTIMSALNAATTAAVARGEIVASPPSQGTISNRIWSGEILTALTSDPTVTLTVELIKAATGLGSMAAPARDAFRSEHLSKGAAAVGLAVLAAVAAKNAARRTRGAGAAGGSTADAGTTGTATGSTAPADNGAARVASVLTVLAAITTTPLGVTIEDMVAIEAAVAAARVAVAALPPVTLAATA